MLSVDLQLMCGWIQLVLMYYVHSFHSFANINAKQIRLKLRCTKTHILIHSKVLQYILIYMYIRVYTYIRFQQSCCHVSCAHRDSCYSDILTGTAAKKKQCNIKIFIQSDGGEKIKSSWKPFVNSGSDPPTILYLSNRVTQNIILFFPPHWNREHNLH